MKETKVGSLGCLKVRRTTFFYVICLNQTVLGAVLDLCKVLKAIKLFKKKSKNLKKKLLIAGKMIPL